MITKTETLKKPVNDHLCTVLVHTISKILKKI